MSATAPTWERYEHLRPDALAALVERHPVAYWPLGLLEHHGWHLPVGFDGVKAEHLCQRCAARTGGVLLPVMWWGGGGGHGPFRWTHYQDLDAAGAILATTVAQLFAHGLRAIVLLAGHYPWQTVLDRRVPALAAAHPGGLILAGTELTVAGDLGLKGDHAAREETSFGLALFPELVDLAALTPGRRDEGTWPAGGAPPTGSRHPGVEFDPDAPLFAQLGQDPRQASAAHGEAGVARLVDRLSARVLEFLAQG